MRNGGGIMGTWTKSWLSLVMVVAAAAPVAAQNEARLVSGWYRTYLHRRPDADGLNNCAYQLRSGESPDAVKAGLIGSDEYYQLHGGTPWGFVGGMFDDVLGRAPTRRDTDYWLNRLNQVETRQTLALEFLKWVNTR